MNLETKATEEQIKHWEKLYDLFKKCKLSEPTLFYNLGLFMRTSLLTKILFLNELYGYIKDITGDIVEFGTWCGQNTVVFENLRAIYEPFNANRRIISFDSFSGYADFSNHDKKKFFEQNYSYSLPDDYSSYLTELVDFHEKNNILGNIKKHVIVKGNVIDTVPKYFESNPQTVVALAYCDVGLYEPTKICLETIKPHLIPGSVIMLDEFNNSIQPGETIAFRELFNNYKYTIHKSRYMTDRTIVIIN